VTKQNAIDEYREYGDKTAGTVNLQTDVFFSFLFSPLYLQGTGPRCLLHRNWRVKEELAKRMKLLLS
jgi:hypothetical protein